MKQKRTGNLIKEGDRAPSFIAKTHQGEVISLKRFRGKMLWLIFYRYPKCPLCNLHLNALRLRLNKYRSQGLEVVCVFETGPEKFKEMKQSLPLGVTAISDPAKVLYRLYQTEVRISSAFTPRVAATFVKALWSGFPQGRVDGQLGQIPASFLIAEDGVIEKVYFGRNIGDHIPFSIVEEFIESRRSGTWKTESG